jgi:hypothetical protein
MSNQAQQQVQHPDAELLKVLTVLAASYPRFALTREVVAVYTMYLRDIPADELRAAAAVCAATRDFFPSVHELRQAVVELRLEQLKLPSAFEAYHDVLQAHAPWRIKYTNSEGEMIERVDVYQWAHPWIREVAEQLGWPSFYPTDNPGVDRAQFARAWEAYVTAKAKEILRPPQVVSYLAGPQKVQALNAG